MLRQEAGGNSNVVIYGHVLFDKLNYAWKRIFYLILLKNLKAFYKIFDLFSAWCLLESTYI